jgi:hypothetical protein
MKVVVINAYKSNTDLPLTYFETIEAHHANKEAEQVLILDYNHGFASRSKGGMERCSLFL